METRSFSQVIKGLAQVQARLPVVPTIKIVNNRVVWSVYNTPSGDLVRNKSSSAPELFSTDLSKHCPSQTDAVTTTIRIIESGCVRVCQASELPQTFPEPVLVQQVSATRYYHYCKAGQDTTALVGDCLRAIQAVPLTAAVAEAAEVLISAIEQVWHRKVESCSVLFAEVVTDKLCLCDIYECRLSSHSDVSATNERTVHYSDSKPRRSAIFDSPPKPPASRTMAKTRKAAPGFPPEFIEIMLKTHCKKKKLDYDSLGDVNHEQFISLLNLRATMQEPASESPAKVPKKASTQLRPPRRSLALLSPTMLGQLHVRQAELQKKYTPEKDICGKR